MTEKNTDQDKRVFVKTYREKDRPRKRDEQTKTEGGTNQDIPKQGQRERGIEQDISSECQIKIYKESDRPRQIDEHTYRDIPTQGQTKRERTKDLGIQR